METVQKSAENDTKHNYILKKYLFFQKIMSVSYGVCPNFEGEISQRCIKSLKSFCRDVLFTGLVTSKKLLSTSFPRCDPKSCCLPLPLFYLFIIYLFICLFSYLFIFLFIYWEISHTFRCLRTCTKILRKIMTFRQWCNLRLVKI